MEAEETITDLTNDLLACRACLATNTKLLKLSENNLVEAFEDVVGNPIFETFDMPQHLCRYCVDLVLKFMRFRDRCRRAQDLLDEAILSGKDITNEFLGAIDRAQHKLAPDLVQTNTLTIDTIARLREEIFDGPGPYGTIAKKYYKDSNMKEEVNDSDDDDDERCKIQSEEYYEPMHVQNIVHYGDREKQDVPNFTELDDVRNDDDEDDGDDNNNDDDKNTDDKTKTEVMDHYKKPKAGRGRNKKIQEEKLLNRREKLKNDLLKFCEEAGLELVELSPEEQERAVAELKEHTALNSDFGCTHCGRPFSSLAKLELHLKAEHEPAAAYACALCRARRRTPAALATHAREHMYKMVCRTHAFSTPNITRMKVHLESHEAQKHAAMRKCDHCEKQMVKREYPMHLRLHHNDTLKEVCRYCGLLYAEARGLAMHVRICHGDVTSSEHQCTKCEARFLSVEALRRHNVSAANTDSCGDFPCVRCGAALPGVGLLRLHLLQHYIRGPDLSEFSCERCGTEFNCPRALAQHRLVESCEEYYSCPQCGAACASPELLAAHGAETHAPTDLSCDCCGRKFKHLAFLSLHYKQCIKLPDPDREARRRARGHRTLGERRWGVLKDGAGLVVKQVAGEQLHPPADGVICDVCGQLYAKSAIAMHMRRHRLKKIERVTCDQCGKGFRTKMRLTDHMNTHTGARPFPCKYCGKMFGQRGTRARHEQRHTGQRPHICHICEKSFIHSTDCKSHIKYVHMNMKGPRRNRNANNAGTKPRLNPILKDEQGAQGEKLIIGQEGENGTIIGQDGNPIVLGQDTIIIRQEDGNKIVIEPNGAIQVQVLGEDGQFRNYDDGSNNLVIEPDVYQETRPKVKVKKKKTKPAILTNSVEAVKVEKRMTKGKKRPRAEFLTQNTEQLETIGAIERIRNIKNSFEDYKEAKNDDDYDDFVDFPPDDYSNGIPEDYAEPSYQSRNHGLSTGGKRAPDPFNSYDGPSTSHRYQSGGKYVPHSSIFTHRPSSGGKYVPQSTSSTHRPTSGGKYVPQTSSRSPSGGKYTGGKRKPEIYSEVSQFSYGEDVEGPMGDREGRKRKSGKHMPML